MGLCCPSVREGRIPTTWHRTSAGGIRRIRSSASSLTHVAPHLGTLPKCDVVELTGLAGYLTTNGVDLVRRITDIKGGTSWPIYAPLVVADARTARSLAGNHQIQETFARQAKVTWRSSRSAHGNRRPPRSTRPYPIADAQKLGSAGVRAETCALLLDAKGNRVPGLDERRMRISEATLRSIPTVIGVTTGQAKIAATKAVLQSGLVSSLVTDAEVAAAVLN